MTDGKITENRPANADMTSGMKPPGKSVCDSRSICVHDADVAWSEDEVTQDRPGCTIRMKIPPISISRTWRRFASDVMRLSMAGKNR
jgi:hypothetical protein